MERERATEIGEKMWLCVGCYRQVSERDILIEGGEKVHMRKVGSSMVKCRPIDRTVRRPPK